MSASVVDALDPATVDGLVARASDPKRERWLQQVRRTGACRHPVRLRGVVVRGEERVYSTADEPDGALMVRCGNRREACCPSCAHEYRGDMWQLVYAGLAGGRKGVPEQVAEHPQVFASLTATSFGPVHSRPDDGRPCRCGTPHQPDYAHLGGAIDPDSYDYESAVLWNWHAPALWNRFTVELVRVLAARAGLSEREWRRRVRVAFAKVAEFQARGLVHFHAIIRLDGAEDRATAPGVQVSPQELCDAIREAVGRARLSGDGQTTDFCFGEQLHTRVVAGAQDGRELNPGQVAAYVAKYSCKASHEQITTRDSDPDRWREHGVPEQLVQMAAATCALPTVPAYAASAAGCTCSASAATSSPSPAATPPDSAICAPHAPTIAPTRTHRPMTLRPTMTTRRSCCRSGNTLAPATSTPATYYSPRASRPRSAPLVKPCSMSAVAHREAGLVASVVARRTGQATSTPDAVPIGRREDAKPRRVKVLGTDRAVPRTQRPAPPDRPGRP
jgi:hypothetical protein